MSADDGDFDESAAAEFVSRVSQDPDPEVGDHVDLDPDSGDIEPMILVGPGTPTSAFHRFVARIEEAGYQVGLEHDGEHQTAYTVVHEGFGGSDGGTDGE